VVPLKKLEAPVKPAGKRSGRNTGYFLPLGVDCWRKLVHLLEEHRDFPDLFVLQRGSKARHCRVALERGVQRRLCDPPFPENIVSNRNDYFAKKDNN